MGHIYVQYMAGTIYNMASVYFWHKTKNKCMSESLLRCFRECYRADVLWIPSMLHVIECIITMVLFPLLFWLKIFLLHSEGCEVTGVITECRGRRLSGVCQAGFVCSARGWRLIKQKAPESVTVASILLINILKPLPERFPIVTYRLLRNRVLAPGYVTTPPGDFHNVINLDPCNLIRGQEGSPVRVSWN